MCAYVCMRVCINVRMYVSARSVCEDNKHSIEQISLIQHFRENSLGQSLPAFPHVIVRAPLLMASRGPFSGLLLVRWFLFCWWLFWVPDVLAAEWSCLWIGRFNNLICLFVQGPPQAIALIRLIWKGILGEIWLTIARLCVCLCQVWRLSPQVL